MGCIPVVLAVACMVALTQLLLGLANIEISAFLIAASSIFSVGVLALLVDAFREGRFDRVLFRSERTRLEIRSASPESSRRLTSASALSPSPSLSSPLSSSLSSSNSSLARAHPITAVIAETRFDLRRARTQRRRTISMKIVITRGERFPFGRYNPPAPRPMNLPFSGEIQRSLAEIDVTIETAPTHDELDHEHDPYRAPSPLSTGPGVLTTDPSGAFEAVSFHLDLERLASTPPTRRFKIARHRPWKLRVTTVSEDKSGRLHHDEVDFPLPLPAPKHTPLDADDEPPAPDLHELDEHTLRGVVPMARRRR